MPFFEITLDPLFAAAKDPWTLAWFLIAKGGWIPLVWLFAWMGKLLWLFHIQTNYIIAKQKPVLLAIDVPRLSLQTPKAVENIFAHLAGAHGSHNRREVYWHGNVQEWFSFEIVSIEGYTQFLVWTWGKFRDLLETAIYAQYPDAQITEVQDYTTPVPTQYPHPEWECFGTEFVLTRPSPYPLRTWEMFEHKGQKEEAFKDPLAAMLENLARIGPGEQIWLQILVKPIQQDSWTKKGEQLVKKLIGAKVETKETFVDTAISVTGSVAGTVIDQVFGAPEAAPQKKKDEMLSKVLYMSPGERNTVELIEKKIAKTGFDCKIRAIYVGRRGVFAKPRGAHAVIGAMKQFNMNDGNSLKPEYKHIAPSSIWLFANLRNNARRRKVIRAYKNRSMWVGMPAYTLNIEELATLWHFPTQAVHAPLIKKTEAKRVEPPAGLPVAEAAPLSALAAKPSSLPEVGPPEGLPIV